MNEIEAPEPIWKRFLLPAKMAVYCAAIFLVLDFGYSKLVHEEDRSGRIPVAYYSHGFLPNFEGYESWGMRRDRVVTNSLGFKDGQTREVPATGSSRRILLIGDSFTEGVGLRFEDTFAGMLYAEGQRREPKIEFLNAGVTSYSPVVYYRKIKYLLDAGLRFDEVIVFSDLSDVQNEAASYFCIDEHAEYRRLCETPPAAPVAPPSLRPIQAGPQSVPKRTGLKHHFVITARLMQIVNMRVSLWTGSSERFATRRVNYNLSAWTLPGVDLSEFYRPLGVEGGIRRSLSNMQALADLLRSRGIGLTIAVYPWPLQLSENDRQSRQVALWREFCIKNCQRFVDLFPAFFAVKDAHPDWYARLFIQGDIHYGPEGNRVIYRELAKRL